jgi:hypothetical protein
MFRFLIEALMSGSIEGLWTRAMSKNRLDDPVYKKNVQELIERNRRFENSKDRSEDAKE